MKKWILLVGVTLCLAGCKGQLNQITSESYSTINHEELAINIDDNEQIDRLNQKRHHQNLKDFDGVLFIKQMKRGKGFGRNES